MCNVNYRVSYYGFHFIYMHVLVFFMQLRKTTKQHGRVFDSVAVFFHSVVEVNFLACVLKLTQRFIVRIISYTNVVYFICIQLFKF
jgi:hypothetical protein